MAFTLIVLVALAGLVVLIGGITALVLYLVKRNKETSNEADLTERVKSLEMEVHKLKSKQDRISHD